MTPAGFAGLTCVAEARGARGAPLAGVALMTVEGGRAGAVEGGFGVVGGASSVSTLALDVPG